MSKPKLTIGMPHYDDFDGAWFTVQALRIFHSEVMDQCEIVIIDNNPKSTHGKSLDKFVKEWASNHVRYIPYTDAVGSAAAKDRLFKEAAGEAVMCVDCHVLIESGAIAKLIQYYNEHPKTRDLLTGPLVYDNLVGLSSHFDDKWRGEMWGTWDTDKRALKPDGEPFAIGAQGGGLMTCRKEAWPGFNPHFRGFGGEEWYIHEKVRKNGANCLCLPFLRWVHRFNRVHGVPYRLAREDKVRNYILGHRELGLSLDRARAHFVDEVKMPQNQWDKIVAEVDAIGQATSAPSPCKGCGKKKAKKTDRASLGELFDSACNTPSDINEHCEKLKELASQSRTVTEFGMRHGVSTVALLAGQPEQFVTYDLKRDPIADTLKAKQGRTEFRFLVGDSREVAIDETDLLFIDTIHTAEQLSKELELHAPRVTRWIAMHDTEIFGENGEDGGPGLLVALRAFLNNNREWSVVYHNQANHGFTVISRDPQDKPSRPGVVTLATHFFGAVAKHVASKAEHASQELVTMRLEQCTLCEQRSDNHCAVCGCDVDKKATWASEECPIGKWIDVEETVS